MTLHQPDERVVVRNPPGTAGDVPVKQADGTYLLAAPASGPSSALGTEWIAVANGARIHVVTADEAAGKIVQKADLDIDTGHGAGILDRLGTDLTLEQGIVGGVTGAYIKSVAGGDFDMAAYWQVTWAPDGGATNTRKLWLAVQPNFGPGAGFDDTLPIADDVNSKSTSAVRGTTPLLGVTAGAAVAYGVTFWPLEFSGTDEAQIDLVWYVWKV